MIVTLTGPSCAGKTTLEKLLVKRGFVNAISTTTREPRAGEVHGETYYFHGRPLFEHGVREGHYVEHVEFGGNYYGLSVAEVERLSKLGKPIVVVCEPIGQKQIAAWCETNHWPILSVFVDNPEQVIAQRFLLRIQNDLNGPGAKHWEFKDKLKSHSGRLKEMMTTERGWVGEAWASNLYNLRLSEFNKDNQDETVEIIAGIAMKEPEPELA